MFREPRPVTSANLSHAWGAAFLAAYDAPVPPPLVVSIDCSSQGRAEEDAEIRSAVDAALNAAPTKSKPSVVDNAAMIFPYRLWDTTAARDSARLFELYPRVQDRIRARGRMEGKSPSPYGTYFGRMTGFSAISSKGSKETVNQLAKLVQIWRRDRANGKRPRSSALQVSCFDPGKDHSGQPVRGFPCLQQVSFDYDNGGNLAIWAYYPTQYLFDRGYGNYLGLSHLGEFMAHELELRLARVVCVVAAPDLGDARKGDLRDLAALVRARLQTTGGGR